MLQTVFTKAHHQYGQSYPSKASEYQAEIVPGKSIRIVATVKRVDPKNYMSCIDVKFDNTFNMGDEAEYDSYNLIYTGKIIKITNNQVWIQEHYKFDPNGKVHHLDLYTFCRRNYKFNMHEAFEHNCNEMQYI